MRPGRKNVFFICLLIVILLAKHTDAHKSTDMEESSDSATIHNFMQARYSDYGDWTYHRTAAAFGEKKSLSLINERKIKIQRIKIFGPAQGLHPLEIKANIDLLDEELFGYEINTIMKGQIVFFRDLIIIVTLLVIAFKFVVKKRKRQNLKGSAISDGGVSGRTSITETHLASNNLHLCPHCAYEIPEEVNYKKCPECNEILTSKK